MIRFLVAALLATTPALAADTLYTDATLIDGAAPSLVWVSYTVAASMVLFALALLLFRHAESRFAERL